jgi:hypothetical protein
VRSSKARPPLLWCGWRCLERFAPEFFEDIEENPAFRAAATLRAMDRLRDALLLIEETA